MDRRRRPDHQTACTSIERLSLRVHPAKTCQPRNSEKSIPSQQELDLERRVPSSGNVGIAWPPVYIASSCIMSARAPHMWRTPRQASEATGNRR